MPNLHLGSPRALCQHKTFKNHGFSPSAIFCGMQFPFKGKWLEQVAILKHLFFSSLSFYSGRWKSASVRFAGTSTNNVGHLHPGGIGSAREMAKFRNYGLGGGWVCGVGLEALGTSASIFSNRVSFRRSPFPTQSSCSHRQSR